MNDLIGIKCGELTVTKSLGRVFYCKRNNKPQNQEKFICECSCGNICERWRNQIVSKTTTTCGDKQKHLLKTPLKDISGKKFDRLIVIKFSHFKREKGMTVQYWLCKCDCGKEKIVNYNSLNNKDTKSCGCLLKETFEYFLTEECIEKRSLPKNEASINQLIYNYKASAKKRNINFELTKNEFIELVYKDCYYCGCEPSRKATKKNDLRGNAIVNGIDRKNNSIGYTYKNCVPCCQQCNYAKHKQNEEDFIKWIKRISKYQFKKDSNFA